MDFISFLIGKQNIQENGLCGFRPLNLPFFNMEVRKMLRVEFSSKTFYFVAAKVVEKHQQWSSGLRVVTKWSPRKSLSWATVLDVFLESTVFEQFGHAFHNYFSQRNLVIGSQLVCCIYKQ